MCGANDKKLKIGLEVVRKMMLMHLFFTRQFVSERKQIALFRHEKLFELSRAVLRDKSLRNED